MRIGNMVLCSYLYYGKKFGTTKKKYYWHRQCEDCPFSWECRSYEDECCGDWGCYAHKRNSQYFSYDIVCLLPHWVKRLIKRLRGWEE